jgi:hypothetical protein
MLQVLIDSHQSFLSKINFDIFMVNLENGEKLQEITKKILEEERQSQKEIANKREQIEKILTKLDKLKKQKE